MEGREFVHTQSILIPKFVEARLHTDLSDRYETFRFLPRITELRAHFAGKGNTTRPMYFVVDPKNPMESLSIYDLGAGGSNEEFAAFLNAGISKAGSPGAGK